MLKKLKTIVLVLAVTIGSGLLISSYVKARHLLPPPAASMATNADEFQILRGEDNFQPDQIARVIISAPEVAEIGELVRFDLSESVAQAFKWIMVPETVDFETYCDGQRAVFSARKPGSYMFIVGCAYDSTVDVATHIVIVKGSLDDPDDPDDPDDVYPNITKPDTNASFDQWVSYWCSINKCSKNETEKLAGSFESIATQIAAGILQKVDDIIKTTAEANREALGESLSDWLPVLQKFQATMKKLAEQGKLSTPDQHQALWAEIAKGLRYYGSLFN